MSSLMNCLLLLEVFNVRMQSSKMQKSRSKALGLSYTWNGGPLVFEDGVRYTVAEAIHLSSAGDETLRAVHLVKKMFDGQVITPRRRSDMIIKHWRSDGDYRFHKAPSLEEGLASLPEPESGPDAEQLSLL